MPFFFALVLWSGSLLADLPTQFPDLAALKAAEMYRLTCSDTVSESHVHVYIVVEKSLVKELKVVTVFPALSMEDHVFSPTDLKGIGVTLTNLTLNISGERPGVYWNETVNLSLRDSARGFIGEFHFSDGDGLDIERKVKCGAINYILNPNH